MMGRAGSESTVHEVHGVHEETQDSPSAARASGLAARERAAAYMRVAERALVVVGLLCVLVYASACAHRNLFQASEERAFDRSLSEHLLALMHDEQYDQGDWSHERVEKYESSRALDALAMGRLEIPTANVSVMVLDGTDDLTLDRAVGRIEGTAQPGEAGNFGIAGHRDGFFRGLQNVQVGDEMSFASLDGLARYQIDAIEIVEPSAVEVLDPTEEASITLVTCYPFYFVGSAPKRYIVKGRRVAFESWSPELLSAYTEKSPAYAIAH
jgi:sortase A